MINNLLKRMLADVRSRGHVTPRTCDSTDTATTTPHREASKRQQFVKTSRRALAHRIRKPERDNSFEKRPEEL